MTKEELLERIKGYEWNDTEFKRAQKAVPEDAYKTVAAFSNTGGGWLVFGIQDNNGSFEIVGVLEVDKVQNDFLSTLRAGQKLNRVVTVNEQIIVHDDHTLLVFYIPEAQRHEKPVHLKKEIHKSYIRRGGGDEQCTLTEIERFLRDASQERYDCHRLENLDAEHCFDDESVAWYRKIYHQNHPGRCNVPR